MHWYVDATTLENFGSVDAMSVLLRFLVDCEPPHWTAGVRSEVLAAMDNPACANVLGCAVLGTPAEVPQSLEPEVNDERVRLGAAFTPGKDRGEAECLVLARHLGGGVVSDDGSAYDYISRKLPPGHTLDTVEVLKRLVADDKLTAYEAVNLAHSIRGAGRHLLWSRPKTLRVDDFMP